MVTWNNTNKSCTIDNVHRNFSINEFIVKYVEINTWHIMMVTIPFLPYSAMCWKVKEGKIQKHLAIMFILLFFLYQNVHIIVDIIVMFILLLFWLRKTDGLPNSITYLKIIIFSASQNPHCLNCDPFLFLFLNYFHHWFLSLG